MMAGGRSHLADRNDGLNWPHCDVCVELPPSQLGPSEAVVLMRTGCRRCSASQGSLNAGDGHVVGLVRRLGATLAARADLEPNWAEQRAETDTGT